MMKTQPPNTTTDPLRAMSTPRQLPEGWEIEPGTDKARKIAAPAKPAAAKVSIRVPKPRKWSEAERGYFLLLRREWPTHAVRYEAVTLNLASGARYSPDFTVWMGGAICLAVEVKGARRLGSSSRSYLAFKTAITEWPHVVFRFAEKQEGGGWATKDYNTTP